jgi:hypothetical protein
MKYYISKTCVTLNEDGKVTGYENVLTRPDSYSNAAAQLKRFKRMGIENIHLCAHPTNGRRYGKLERAYNKRRKADRQLTLGEVAEIMADDTSSDTEASESARAGS